MTVETLILIALGTVALLSSLGILLSRDNLYATLYMVLTMVMIGTIYAMFNLQPIFILIVFVFVGALGVVTVALASTYRRPPSKRFAVNALWILPVAAAAVVIGGAAYLSADEGITVGDITDVLIAFPVEYVVLIALLIALMITTMLGVMKFMMREEDA